MIPYNKNTFKIENRTEAITNETFSRLLSNKMSKISTLVLLLAMRSILKAIYNRS